MPTTTPISLTHDNPELQDVNVGSSQALGEYVDAVLERNDAVIAWGGYLEQRKIYQRSGYFAAPEDPDDERNIHIGVDYWARAGTKVIAAFDGVIHSFQNNTNHGDYGPTIILEHEINGEVIHSLYGHLSLESLAGKEVGQKIQQGEVIAWLGTAEVNGDYPPHLHFQLIRDMQGMAGDYPGVCSKKELGFYKGNCPDPIEFIQDIPLQL